MAKQKTLKSGARVSSEEVPYEYKGPLGRTRSALAIVPVAKELDTTGARSAAEVFGSQASLDKWYAKSQSRPMTEAEFAEYRTMRMPFIGTADSSQQQMRRRGLPFGGLPRLRINPRSYQEYLGLANRRQASSSTSGPSRLGVGGGTRATGLGY